MSTATYYLSDGITSRPVTDSVLRIGRGDECEIRLADRSVSRQHCMIFLQGQSLMLRDLNSSNGTYVNGNRIAFAKLRIGDFIIVGNTGFVVEDTEHSSLWKRLNAFSNAEAVAMTRLTALANEWTQATAEKVGK